MRNNLFVLILTVLAGEANADSPVFAVTKVGDNSAGISSVTIIMTRDRKECDNVLQGNIEVNKKAEVQSTSYTCVDTLPSEYRNSFENKPIPGAIVISYKNYIWPTRTLMYGAASDWFSEEGCAYLLKTYQAKDPNASCIYGK